MNVCSKCGSEVFEGNKYCIECGNKIDNNKQLIPIMSIIIGIIALILLVFKTILLPKSISITLISLILSIAGLLLVVVTKQNTKITKVCVILNSISIFI